MKRMTFTVRGGRLHVSPGSVGRRHDVWIDDEWVGRVRLEEASRVEGGFHAAIVGANRVIESIGERFPEGPDPPAMKMRLAEARRRRRPAPKKGEK